MTANPVTLIFLGPPGSGKGTQAEVLAEELQIPHISTGEILRRAIADHTPLGEKAKAYMDQGELVPDELLLGLIENRLTQEDALKGWILDGFPRNVAQASFLDQLLAKIDQRSNYVINLAVPDEILVERLLSRGRQDDNEDTIRRRLVVYQEQTAPVIDYYQTQAKLISIDGDRAPGEVTESLKQIVQT
jgi:adenylate kinase